MEHIREAEEFAREVGGSDTDVKKYFFGLSASELRPIFDDYEKAYGSDAREYAESTVPLWKNGKRKMAGQTAKRLYSLLPSRMPVQARLNLVRTLWITYREYRNIYLVFGPDVSAHDVGECVKGHLNEVAKGHEIPDRFKRRFTWLSDGDSAVYEQLLNYCLGLERDLARRAAEGAVRVVSETLENSGNARMLQSFKRTVEVDGCRVTLILDKSLSGVRLTKQLPAALREPSPAVPSQKRSVPQSGQPLGEGNGCAIPALLVIFLAIVRGIARAAGW